VTPETETTTHYFFQQGRRVEEGDHSIAEALYKSLLVAFEEDRAMITAQSQSIDADPEAPMLLLAMDAAVVRFRKLVAETIAAENADRAAPIPQPVRTSATRARSPDWRAFRSQPSARAASATGQTS
jgi:vanillate O-demethylase monooxygenase subunit